jgi:hypothetical protein
MAFLVQIAKAYLRGVHEVGSVTTDVIRDSVHEAVKATAENGGDVGSVTKSAIVGAIMGKGDNQESVRKEKTGILRSDALYSNKRRAAL